jgi:hypothetical protein
MSRMWNGLEIRRFGRWVALGALGITSALFLWRVFFPALTTMTHSYPAYYTASRLVLEGRFGPQAYDDAWFEARVLEMTQGRVSDHFSLHPPTTWLLLVPVAWLDLTTARIVWQVFNLGLFLAALWLILGALNVQDIVWRILFITFALVFPPLAENMRVGQTYILILFLFALALWGEIKQKHLVTGIGLGIAAGLKLSGAPIWLLLAVRGQWRALFWSTVVGFLSALLGLAVLGWGAWLGFFQRVLDYSKPVPLASHVAFQATPSFLQRMFVASPQFNPTPLFDAPGLASVFGLIISGLALGLMLWFARRAAFEIAFATAVTSGVILFPMATEYHYTLLLIPLAVTGWHVITTRQRFDAVWFAAILILLCVPFDWNAPHWSTREFMLLAYPRLYGGWLLWLWLVKQMAMSYPARVSSQTRVRVEQTA